MACCAKTRRDLAEGALTCVVKPLTNASFEQARIKLAHRFPELAHARAPQEGE